MNPDCAKVADLPGTIIKYGTGEVAYEERFNGYAVRYEASSVPELLSLMDAIADRRRREKEAKNPSPDAVIQMP